MKPNPLPPHDDAAERSLLGSLLRWNESIDDVAQRLSAGDFYKHHHGLIYAAVLTLRERGHPVDLTTLANLLKERGQIKDIGGYACLAELWDNEPTGAQVMSYAGIVREKAIARYVRHACAALVADADAGAPGTDLLERAERSIF